MKTAQWTAVLALALMVGGITFVMVYLGGTKTSSLGPSADDQAPVLTFASKRYPEEGAKVLTSEIRQEGHQDYWFDNDSGKPVQVGLIGKSCTCANVEVSVVSESWRSRLLAQAGFRWLQRGVQRLDDLATWAATYQPDKVFATVPDNEVTTMPLDRDDSVTVQPGSLGWVRIRWHRKAHEALKLYAELWMGQMGGPMARLEAGVRISDPMEALSDVSVGSFDVHELEKGKKVSLVFWSVTRPSLHVKATLAPLRGGKAESDPIELGEPVPLGAEGMRKLEKSQAAHMVHILCAYKIPLTLHARAKDGTPFDWGHFRRFVTLSSEDENIEPVQVDVTGEVRGDVAIGGGKESGLINLGPFPRSRGAHGDILLQTDVQGLTLELDRSRLPEYLKVSFSDKPEVTGGGHRIWALRVEVPANAAQGEFPRSEDPIYRDSAIYVKTTHEKPARLIRIPVRGTANEG
jgi:hypothetical protein